MLSLSNGDYKFVFFQADCCADGFHCCPDGTRCNADSTGCDPVVARINPFLLPRPFHVSAPLVVETNDIICPDKKSSCQEGTTCCHMKNAAYGCCPTSNVRLFFNSSYLINTTLSNSSHRIKSKI